MSNEEPQLLTINQAAQLAGLSRKGIDYWLGRGLDAQRLGHYWYVTPAAFERWQKLPVAKGGLKRRKGYAQVATSGQEYKA